jgi:GMP synthase-like glutamine amidotransferase
MKKKEVKVAVIDMNNGAPNLGLKSIIKSLSAYQSAHSVELLYEVFDLRLKNEIPGLTFDIYISSGGPGSPFEGEGQQWEKLFFDLLDSVECCNKLNESKKHVFLICYSFQLACRKYNLGTVKKRESNAFGIFPISLCPEGEKDKVYAGLPNPFYAVDSRDWQVVNPNEAIFEEMGAALLAIEKPRSQKDLARCMMSIRFSEQMIGTQFHPEADPEDLKTYLLKEEKKEAIIDAQGEGKYNDMLDGLDNKNKVRLTEQQLLPNFLTAAIQSFK